ncbi:lipopolysaccharide biosynthesis protein [Allopusillimonas ginsengisoli]|uniref:lipopolysaccharide biosynthesis protein n=1 Tax=Allopusillimonas ginsengisoli TaxID=453575 RepID=UPI0014321BAD|nr:oligosaccharide flippase family protein [Allopusillimonas ginsengisoli]
MPKIRNEFGRNVVTLMTGTTLAQALPIALSPLLSRLYAPDDFGVLGLYMAVCAILSVLAAGRYEIAILQPKDDNEAANIAALSVVITLGTAIALWLVILCFWDGILAASNSPELGRWLYLLPASVLLTGLYQILNYWNNRQKRFKQLAVSRAVQSAGAVGTQCALGFQHGAGNGLIAGFVIGQVCGLLSLGRANLKSARDAWQAVSAKGIRSAGVRYKKFPLFSSWGALLDTAALQMPLLVIAQMFGATITGLFSFAFRVLTVPLNLISGSIAQVLFQRVAELHNDNPSVLGRYLLRIFLLLCCVSALPILLFTLFGREIFTVVFGEAWAPAGDYAGILVIAAAARFTVYPLSVVLSLDHNLKKGVAWQVLYFATLTTVLFAFSNSRVDVFLKAFAIHEVILYAIYLGVILWATRYLGSTHREQAQASVSAPPAIPKP